MLLMGCEVNNNNVQDWSMGTLRKFQSDLRQKIINDPDNSKDCLKLFELICYEIVKKNIDYALYEAMIDMHEEVIDE